MNLWKAFPTLDPTEKILQDYFGKAVVMDLPAGKILLTEGTICQAVPLVLEGSIRVFKISDSGREITLYRIEGGQSCILSSSCVLSEGTFPALAQVEENTRAILLPAPKFQSLMVQSPSWSRMVFSQYSSRLALVITLVEEIAFRKVDQRLAGLIMETAEGQSLTMTHQEMASSLGTTREVISRILKEFEREGLLKLHRGSLEVMDKESLVQLSKQ